MFFQLEKLKIKIKTFFLVTRIDLQYSIFFLLIIHMNAKYFMHIKYNGLYNEKFK